VVRAFVRLRQWAVGQADLARRLATLERRVSSHDRDMKAIITSLRQLLAPSAAPRARIGFVRD